MRVGVTVDLSKNRSLEEQLARLKEFGMDSCQLVCWERNLLTGETAEQVNNAMNRYGVEITAFWCGWEGPRDWNFYDGQLTLGLVPEAYRFRRMEMLMQGSEFASWIHTADLVTHAGFMPENPYDPNYPAVLVALKKIARRCKENGQYFLFETGQETPVTLLRVIQDIGADNVGINLDPANLIMYGKANPVDALDVFGKYVRGIHGKDGCYPTDGRALGPEVPLGEGKVNFPRLIARLKEIGYDGDITIEREITGEQQSRDIIQAKQLLDELIAK